MGVCSTPPRPWGCSRTSPPFGAAERPPAGGESRGGGPAPFGGADRQGPHGISRLVVLNSPPRAVCADQRLLVAGDDLVAGPPWTHLESPVPPGQGGPA